MTLQSLIGSFWSAKGSWCRRRCESVYSKSCTESIKEWIKWINLSKEPGTRGSGLAWLNRSEAYSDLPILSGAPTHIEKSSSYPCDHNQCHDHGLWHFPHAGRWYSCIVDHHTGYPRVKPIKNQEADTVSNIFRVFVTSLVIVRR